MVFFLLMKALFVLFVILPWYLYQLFNNTLPGVILHIIVTLGYRLIYATLHNIFDFTTPNYRERNIVFLVIIVFILGYKYLLVTLKSIKSFVYRRRKWIRDTQSMICPIYPRYIKDKAEHFSQHAIEWLFKQLNIYRRNSINPCVPVT